MNTNPRPWEKDLEGKVGEISVIDLLRDKRARKNLAGETLDNRTWENFAKGLQSGGYDAEVIVSSRGHYIYHCICGNTTQSMVSDEGRVRCGYDPCGRVLTLNPPRGKPMLYFIEYNDVEQKKEENL